MAEPDLESKRAIRVPDLPAELLKDQYRHETYNTATLPPFLSTTEAAVTEKFNTDPNLLRSTIYTLPTAEGILTASAIPFALIATPFSARGIYSSVSGADSCSQCRSFSCCFTVSDGSSRKCHICGHQTGAPLSHPESLKFSSMELPTTPPSLGPPVFVFFIDFSFPWIPNLLDTAEELFETEEFKQLYKSVIFIVANEGLSLYSNKDGLLKRYKMPGQTVPKISADVLVETDDAMALRKILNMIRQERANLRGNNVPRLDSVLRDISSFVSAAKVALFTCQRGVDYNFEEFLKSIRNLSISVFTESKLDPGNTLASLAFYTSGLVCGYRPDESSRFRADLIEMATVRTVFNLSVVLKVSDNIVKTGVISQDVEENFSMTRLSAMDSNSAVTFLLSLSGASKATKYIQLQVSYTDSDGSSGRLILNHSFATGSPTALFGSVSADVLFAALCKMSISEETDMEGTLSKILSFYRKTCTPTAAATQFILPEAMKYLPVLVQAFSKNTDASGLNRTRLVGLDVERTLRYFYPRLFSLSDFSRLSLTPSIRLSISNLSDGEIYIMENGFIIYIYLGRLVDEVLVDRLFSFDSADPIRQDGTEESELLRRAVDEINQHYNRALDLRVVRAGSPEEVKFLGYMMEDSLNNRPDYVDFIFKMHFQIQRAR